MELIDGLRFGFFTLGFYRLLHSNIDVTYRLIAMHSLLRIERALGRLIRRCTPCEDHV